MQTIIKLNIGGEKFDTTKEILIKSKYFEDLFNEYSTFSERIFIDRSPHIFKHILALLRDSRYQYPEKYKEELDYFGIKKEFNLKKPKEVFVLNNKLSNNILGRNLRKYYPFENIYDPLERF